MIHHKVDADLFDFKDGKEPVKSQPNNIFELWKSLDAEHKSAQICILESISISSMDYLSSALDCDISVFHNHLQRAGDDVVLSLPSVSRAQSHVMIPYRRTYRPNPHKWAQVTRNARSTFSHGALVATEEHVTVSISVKEGGWRGKWTLLRSP